MLESPSAQLLAALLLPVVPVAAFGTVEAKAARRAWGALSPRAGPVLCEVRSRQELLRRWQCWMIVVLSFFVAMIRAADAGAFTVALLFVTALEAVDFVSGVYHAFLDKSPIYENKSVVDCQKITFHLHHLRPRQQWSISKDYSPLFESLLMIPALCCYLGTQVVLQHVGVVAYPLVRLWLGFAFAFATYGNAIHYFAHDPHPPAIVAALQRWRLLLSPEAHQRHHRTHDSDFCIVTGHTDPLVNWVYGIVLKRLWPFARVSREEERRFDQALDVVYGPIY